MKEELKYAVNNLEKGLTKLADGTETAKDELDKDGVIQRFEFTFELLWKTIKIFMRTNGIDVKTPKESLMEAFKIGWIQDDEIFLDMLEDRNKTSHIYDKETSEVIFERIKSRYLPSMRKVLNTLKKNIS